jgi:hypothetical protein
VVLAGQCAAAANHFGEYTAWVWFCQGTVGRCLRCFVPHIARHLTTPVPESIKLSEFRRPRPLLHRRSILATRVRALSGA